MPNPVGETARYGQRAWFDPKGEGEPVIDLAGASKTELAIARLRNFEPPEGYYLEFSGGKDSVVIMSLAQRAGVQFDAHYHFTTCDPPELVHFVRTFENVSMDHAPKTMWQLIPERGMPRRQGRWCCQELKEIGGSGRTVVTGVRHAESKGRTRRSHRKMVEQCFRDPTKWFVNPIVDWTDTEVWDYIEVNKLETCSLYREGFERLGCVLCPMTRDVERQMARWPKIADAWHRASDRYYEKGGEGVKRFPSAAAFWAWWIDRDVSAPKADQGQLSEDDEDDEYPEFGLAAREDYAFD